MRLLADNPSMDDLRSEAKDLLQSLRTSDDGATLAVAQAAVAAEYGFRTWGEMKAEVDRRRVAVPAAAEGLAEGLSDAFGLGAVTGPMKPIRYEYMATTLMHWTQSGANLEAARALLFGYRERSGRSPHLTLAAFTPAVTGWLTWLLHRGWEASDSQPSEKRDFSERTLPVLGGLNDLRGG